MPKLKTHSGAAKRFKKTGTGKVKRGHAFARHILTSKDTKKKRHLDKDVILAKADDEENPSHDSVLVGRLSLVVSRSPDCGGISD